MSLPDISELTKDERLELIERLWDSLSSDPDAIPLTRAQEEELDRRLDDLGRNGSQGIPWEQVVENIRKRER